VKARTLRKWLLISFIRLLIFPFETMDINFQAIAEWRPVKTYSRGILDTFDVYGVNNIQNMPDKIDVEKNSDPGVGL
jgi:hypothetical protein